MRFYLGTHEPRWLALTDVPLFLSRRRLARVKRLPRARGPYAIDSGGFSELSMFGRWRTTPEQYVDAVRRFVAEIGPPGFCAPQDWMCEDAVREITGLSVAEHQEKTVASYVELRERAPEIPWAPVLQGWSWGDHERHVGLYERAGVDLRAAPVVGVGSVCRRSGATRTSLLLKWLAQDGLRLHAFGVKSTGLVSAANVLASADSLAWSYRARRDAPLPECAHARCSSCIRYALEYRDALLRRIERERHTELRAA